LKRARTLQAKAAQKDKATRDLGNSLQVAQDMADAARENVESLAEQVENLQTDANDVEKALTGSARYQKLLASRAERRLEVERRQKRSDERNEDLAARGGEVWRAVVASLVAEHLQKSHQVEDVAALQAEMLTLRARRTALRAVGGDPDLITRLEKEADQARVDLSDAQGQLSDVEAELADAPAGTVEAVSSVVVKLAGLTASLTNTRSRLTEARQDASAKELAVASLSDRLRRSGAASTGAEDRKVELLSQLHALLVAAVTDFRERLREAVEEEATKVFKLLSAEPDYDRLRINDNYGLSILFADGSPVINRSSGYEHVVALSLIAALQRCSPMSGPIITDSPFGRLDRTHKRHVLAALPQISDQVMLLVHDDELDRQVALAQLRNGELVAEHHLRRVSGRHTQIERGAPA
jgi:DNA sulfur modification protein DndD